MSLRLPYGPDNVLLIARVTAALLRRQIVHIPAVVVETSNPLNVVLHVGDLSEQNPMISSLRAFVHHFPGRFRVYYHRGSPIEGVPADKFVFIGETSDRDAAIMIRQSGANVLLETSWWTPHGAPGVALHRPLPVQILWATEYPSCSGSTYAFDYLVTDEHSMHSQLTEYPLILGPTFLFPDLGELHGTKFIEQVAQRTPGDDNRAVAMFVGDPALLTQQSLDLWASACLQAPELHVVMGLHPDERSVMRRWSGHHGLEPSRLKMVESVSSMEVMARLGDFVLDLPEYNGGASTLRALVAGLPVVHLDGPSNKTVERMGSGILHAADLSELVASDTKDYIDKIIRLATDVAYRTSLLEKLRSAVTCSGKATLFCAKDVIPMFHAAIDRAWKQKPGEERKPIHLGMKVEYEDREL